METGHGNRAHTCTGAVPAPCVEAFPHPAV